MATGDKVIDQLSMPPSAVKALAEAEAQQPKCPSENILNPLSHL